MSFYVILCHVSITGQFGGDGRLHGDSAQAGGREWRLDPPRLW